MDQTGKPSQRISWSAEASLNLANIYRDTTYNWGVKQADRYLDMIYRNADFLSEYSRQGREVDGFPNVRSYFVKWSKARHGHHIVFQNSKEGIHIVAVLHSSMDVESQLRRVNP